MEERTCSHCKGTGKERHGTFRPIDPEFDFLTCFEGYCCSDEWKAKKAQETKDLMLSLKPGDMVFVQGLESEVLEVGMYDGWPFWKPKPAIRYRTWLGGEISFAGHFRR